MNVTDTGVDGDTADAEIDSQESDALPGGDSEPDSDVDTLEMDDVFHVLQNERRRNVLRYLEDVDGVIEMRDMAVQIAAWENDTTVQQLHSDQRQRVYIALYQSHLPKMDKLGLIEYNKPRGYVEPRPRLDTVLAYLNPEPATGGSTEEVTGDASTERTTLVGATGVATLLVAAAWVGMTPALLSGIGIATAVLVLYASTIAYTYRSEIGLPSALES